MQKSSRIAKISTKVVGGLLFLCSPCRTRVRHNYKTSRLSSDGLIKRTRWSSDCVTRVVHSRVSSLNWVVSRSASLGRQLNTVLSKSRLQTSSLVLAGDSGPLVSSSSSYAVQRSRVERLWFSNNSATDTIPAIIISITYPCLFTSAKEVIFAQRLSVCLSGSNFT